MNRQCLLVLFGGAVAWTIVLVVVHYSSSSPNADTELIKFGDSSWKFTDQKNNSVDTKRAVITSQTVNQTTALKRNGDSNSTINNTASSPGNELTHFIYLTQTESCIGPHLLRPGVFGDGCKNDVIVLSWQQPCTEQNSAHIKHIKYIYKANTSWSVGRNVLYRYAKESPKDYLYYIFLDDDVTLDFANAAFRQRYRDLNTSSPLQAFENFLLKHEPAIAVPMYCNGGARCDKMKHLKPMPEYLPVTIHFDAAFNAFHRSALDVMLPYRLDYENESWWQSQKFVVLAADLIFRGQVLRFAPLLVSNNAHRQYPRWDAENWTHIYNLLKDEIPKEFRDKIDWTWKPRYGDIDVMPVVTKDTVITPTWRMKIPTGKITVEPFKYLKTS